MSAIRTRSLTTLERKLEAFHRSRVECCLGSYSPIAGWLARSDFNQAPHYRTWEALGEAKGSFWGVDRCLRIREPVDPYHSRVFHAGLCARSVARSMSAAHPWEDPAFDGLQRDVLSQFLSMVEWLGIDNRRLQASCFGGATLGGQPDGRGQWLRRPRRFPADRASRQLLRARGIPVSVVPTIASFVMQPEEGSLVGPRVEVFYDEVEFATLVFAYGRLQRGMLTRSHYVAAYAVGMERVLAILKGRDFLHAIDRYALARRLIQRRVPAADSPTLRQDLFEVLFGVEALAVMPPRLSKAQRALLRQMKRRLKSSILNLGLSYRDILRLYQHFQRAGA